MEKVGEVGGSKPAYSIIVPTYNERLNVALIIYLIFKHLQHSGVCAMLHNPFVWNYDAMVLPGESKLSFPDVVTIDDLIHVITPKGRASVPDPVKAELLQRIRSFLMSSSLW